MKKKENQSEEINAEYRPTTAATKASSFTIFNDYIV